MGYFMGYIITMYSLRPDASDFSFVLFYGAISMDFLANGEFHVFIGYF